MHNFYCLAAKCFGFGSMFRIIQKQTKIRSSKTQTHNNTFTIIKKANEVVNVVHKIVILCT